MRPRVGRALVFGVAAILASLPARAELSGYLQWETSRQKTETTTTGTPPAETETDTFAQFYRITFDRDLFPKLSLRIGGLFEREDSEVRQVALQSDVTRKRWFPYVSLTLRSKPFFAELGFERRDDRLQTGGTEARTIQDLWRGIAGWRMEDTLRTRLELYRRKRHDGTGLLLDSNTDSVQAALDYRPRDTVEAGYLGTWEKNNDRIQDSESRTLNHSAHVGYHDAWLDRRVVLNLDYNLNHRSVETIRAGTGEAVFPVFPLAGLSSLDEFPQSDPLLPNPALIDGNRFDGAGVNLGLPPPGGDARPRNFGIDFGNAEEFNFLAVWIDRELPPEIAREFTWQIYTSEDNLDWTLRQTFPVAPFGPFENRFDFRLSGFVARYVKVVVAPLDPTVPTANLWPQILVTEIESELRRPTADLASESSTTSHALNGSFRSRLMDEIALFYELTTYINRRDEGRTRWSLGNGLYVTHAFNPVWSTAARVTREDRRERGRDEGTWYLSGSVTASPLPALRHQLTVSGNRQDAGVDSRRGASMLFNSTAQLYPGIDLTFGYGQSNARLEDRSETAARDLNLGFTFVPHSSLTVNLSTIDRRADKMTPGFARLRTEDLTIREAAAAWRPLSSFYLFASRRWEESLAGLRDVIDSYTATFAPFPDGTVTLSMFYTEFRRDRLEQFSRSFVPTIRWDITSRTYLQVFYQKTRNETLEGRLRTELLAATFRIAF